MSANAPETIVLLHGFTQTGRSWGPTIAALGERYRALAPDLRGHGDAADVRPVDVASIRADLLVLAPRRFALAGYSMGGRIALGLALHEDVRDRVERLVLIGASPGLASAGERAARAAADDALATEIEHDGIEPFARRWAAQPLFAGQSPDAAAAAHAERLGQSPAGLAAALRGLGTGTMQPLWDRLGELRMPVALVVGEHDEKFRAIAERMAAAILDATLHVVAGAGHAVQLEAPDAVARILAGL
jgi:2-succinyl-6-hydroxy-2,4-cyclohexadiene-1-carboxylate synthase